MRLRIAPKIVICVSTVLTLSASLVYASVSGSSHGVSTGSGSDRVALSKNIVCPRLPGRYHSRY